MSRNYEDLAEMRDEFLRRRHKAIVHRKIPIIALLNLALVIIQLRNSLFEGWVVLAITGFSLAVCIYLVGDLKRQRYLNELEKNSNLINLKNERTVYYENITTFLSILLVVSILSGYNAYQSQQEKNEFKQSAIDRGFELQRQGWCGEFEDIEVNDWGDVTKTGGWPCIYAGDFRGIEFKQINGKDTTCGTFTFHIEMGRPGQKLFSLGQEIEELCVSNNEYSIWGEYALKDKMFEYIKPKLDLLKIDLCNYYGYTLSSEERSLYCSY
jgi:hypothetical protein